MEQWLIAPNTELDSPLRKSGAVPVEVKATVVLVEDRSDTTTGSAVI